MHNPRVSVIIPVYNIECYIERCLRSVMEQSFKELEIIVVNDGSTDNSGKIVQNLADTDTRIVVINKENGGLSSARNFGLDIAKGEYILHIDGDDWIGQGCLEALYNKAVIDDLDVVVTDYWKDYDDGSKTHIVDMPIGQGDIIDGKIWLEYFFARAANQSVYNKLFRRAMYNNVRHPEHISMGEDLATIPRVMYKAQRIGKLNKAYYRYIQRADSIVNSVSPKNTEKTINSLLAAFVVLQEFFSKEQDIRAQLEKYRIAQIAIFIFTPNVDLRSELVKKLALEYLYANIQDRIVYSNKRITLYSLIVRRPGKRFLLSLVLQLNRTLFYMKLLFKAILKCCFGDKI